MSHDLRSLLKEHAPQPSGELDLAHLAMAARRRPHSRWIPAAAAAGGALAAVGVMAVSGITTPQPASAVAVAYNSETVAECGASQQVGDTDEFEDLPVVVRYETTVEALRAWEYGWAFEELMSNAPDAPVGPETRLTICLVDGVVLTEGEGDHTRTHSTNGVVVLGPSNSEWVLIGDHESGGFRQDDLPAPAPR